jgi:hypothetical protein
MITSINVSSFSSASLRASEGVSVDVSGKGPLRTCSRGLLGPEGALEAARLEEARELLVEAGVRLI